MRIAQLIDSLYVGGAEKLQVTFMREALKRGLKPTLITFNFFPEKPFYRELREMGAEMIEIKGRSLFDPFMFWKLLKTLRAGKFDVLHTHLAYSIILGGLAGKLTGTPVVASIHNLKPDSWALLEALSLRFLTTCRVAVGDAVMKAHQTGFHHYPMQVVFNPVEPILPLDEKKKSALRSSIMPDPSRLLLITVGRLIAEKGYDDLLDALNELRQKHPRVFLAIVGVGDFLPNVNAKIQSLGLEDHVRMLGARGDVPDLLAASDLYVSASHWEGLPVSILEAMSAGLPIVATAVGDVPLVVKPQAGICVPAHQPAQLAQALASLVDQPELRVSFGAYARAYVAQNHSIALWFDRLLEVYGQAASRRA